MMIAFVFILEFHDRGLIFGWPQKHHEDSLGWSQIFRKMTAQTSYIMRKYHGYCFVWFNIWTFWYHPLENTFAHATGIFLIWQFFAAIKFDLHGYAFGETVAIFCRNFRGHSRSSSRSADGTLSADPDWAALSLADVSLRFRLLFHPNLNIHTRHVQNPKMVLATPTMDRLHGMGVYLLRVSCIERQR